MWSTLATRLAGALAVVVVAAGCGGDHLAGTRSTSARSSARSTPAPTPATTTPAQPTPAQPTPAPTTPARLAGAPTIDLVAADGPVDPPGPFAADSVAALLRIMRHAQGGRPLDCDPKCWAQAPPLTGKLVIAVLAAPTVCYSVSGTATRWISRSSLGIDLTVERSCSIRPGAGTLARGRDVLLALPLAQLPVHESLTIVLRGRRQGGAYTAYGTTTVAT